MSDTVTETPTDKPPTPLDAAQAAKPATPAEKPTETTESAPADDTSGVTASEREELAKLRAIHKDEQKWERRAKENFEKAKRLDEIELAKKSVEERLIAERDKALEDVEAERTERLREKISRETGVPPGTIFGKTEDDMRDSAESALEWAKEFAAKNKGPVGAPAAAVTGDGKGPQVPAQLTQSDLKGMSSQAILQADKDGRLAQLKGTNS